ncbi:MAG: glycoside hydrolase family 25 protein [Mogibacterium sp.]|nr:glycoside hydrolase family 25 protein [Mogibacterium sp.]
MTENNIRKVLREDGSDATKEPVYLKEEPKGGKRRGVRPARRKSLRKSLRKSSKNRKTFNKFTLIVILACIVLLAIMVIKVISYVSGISHQKLSGKGFTHNKRYEDCLKIKGIDVSEFQKEIKWKKVKSSDADFVFIRAGYRSAKTGELKEDANFKDNIKAACKSGIMVGVYFYSQAINVKEAEEEADYLVSLVKRYDIDLPLVIDYELYSGGRLEKAIEAEELFAAGHFNEIVTVFCRRVEEHGYESAIYGNYDMFTNYMDATLIDKKYTLWAAQYGGKCDVKADYMFWQATDSAEIDGIEGKVDMDFWYIEPGKVYPTRAKGKKKQTSIKKCDFEFESETVKLKNHRAVPEISLSKDGKKLKKGKDYQVSFIQNTKNGTGYAIVRGIKKYKGWTAVPFNIE